MEHKWVHSSAYSSIPPDAVLGGNDVDGATIYVGRAFHNGDTLVAKVIPAKHIAYVSWRGDEIPKEHFEVLCGTNLVWRQCYHHVIPENAVLCGTTSLGQSVYVGRGHCEGSLTVGKVSSVHRALFIPFKGGERRLESYELLLMEKEVISWPDDLPPPPPLLLEEKKVYPMLDSMKPKPALGFGAMPQPPPYPNAPPLLTPAEPPPPYMPVPPPFSSPYANAVQVLPNNKCPYPPPPPPPQPPSPLPSKSSYIGMPPNPYGPLPQKTPASTYQPQPQITPQITPASTYQPPPPPPPPPSSYGYGYSTPATTYRPPQHDTWVVASSSHTPRNAVHAGHDSDLSSIMVCRAYHDGDLIPGKAVPSHGTAYISYGGQEIRKTHYEVLVGEGYHWVAAHAGNIAPGAVEAGRTCNGEPLYVARAHFRGSLTPGKLQRSHGCLYIPYAGVEHRITSYEVLVRRADHYHGELMDMCY